MQSLLEYSTEFCLEELKATTFSPIAVIPYTHTDIHLDMPIALCIIAHLRLWKLHLGLSRIWIPRVLSSPCFWFCKSFKMDLFLVRCHLTLCIYTCRAHKHMKITHLNLYPSDSRPDRAGWGVYWKYISICFWCIWNFYSVYKNFCHWKIKMLNGLPFPSPGNLPDPGIESLSPALQADSLLFEPPGKPFYFHYIFLYLKFLHCI